MSNQLEVDSRETYKSLVQMMNEQRKDKNQGSSISFRKSPFYQKQRGKGLVRAKSFIRSNTRQMSMISYMPSETSERNET